MSDKLPELIDPLLFAERRTVLSGQIKIADFERLSAAVVNNDGVVQVGVVFAKEGKRAVVSGTIKAALELECQSCLQALPWPLEIAFRLAVVSSLHDADGLEIDCEPFLFDGEKISLSELIEDEILLALPDYPKHEEDCIRQRSSKDGDYDSASPTQANNPFSVLAKLKKTGE